MFWDCCELVNYEIPPRVTRIGESAFVVPWKNIKLPDSLVYIGKEAFRGTYTQNLDIPSKVKVIDDGAFYGSNRLKSVRIPASVEFIGKEAFACCDSLEYFEVDSLNMNFCSIDGVLYSKDKKSLICYPAGKNKKYGDAQSASGTSGNKIDGISPKIKNRDKYKKELKN